MAKAVTTITVETAEYRPCIVNEEEALFHRWEQRSELLTPSPLRGGHSGGVVSGVLGIAERKDGTVFKAYPENIRFLDSAERLAKAFGEDDEQNEV